MRSGVWRKGTKKDVLPAIIATLVFGLPILFLAIWLYSIDFMFGVIFTGVAIAILSMGVKIFVRHVILGLPYEYYIHVKFIPSHYKGPAVGLPLYFSDLTEEQNEYLAKGKFPPTDGNDYYNHQSSVEKMMEKIEKNNVAKTVKTGGKKGISIVYIIIMIMGVVTIIQFLVPFASIILNTYTDESFTLPVMLFVIVFFCVFAFAGIYYIRTIIKFIKKLFSPSTTEDNNNNNKDYTEYVDNSLVDKNFKDFDDEDDPFAKYNDLENK